MVHHKKMLKHFNYQNLIKHNDHIFFHKLYTDLNKYQDPLIYLTLNHLMIDQKAYKIKQVIFFYNSDHNHKLQNNLNILLDINNYYLLKFYHHCILYIYILHINQNIHCNQVYNIINQIILSKHYNYSSYFILLHLMDIYF